MDLDHNNENKLSEHFVYKYMIKSYDRPLQDLIYFLMCYKICVRAKVTYFNANNQKSDMKKSFYVREAKNLSVLSDSYVEHLVV